MAEQPHEAVIIVDVEGPKMDKADYIDTKSATQDTVHSIHVGDMSGEMRVTNSAGEIYLAPQPSFSAMDPLNWSQTRKVVVTIIICLWSAVALSAQSFFTNFLPQIQAQFPDRSAGDINLLFTICAPLVAPADIIYLITALRYGYRPTFIAATVVFLLSSIIGATCSGSYTGLVASRILAGLGTSPSDALQYAMIEGFTFVHERGLYFGLLTSIGGGGQLLITILTSYMAVLLSIREYGFQPNSIVDGKADTANSAFIFYSAVNAALLVLLWFFLPEINFRRDGFDSVPQMELKQHRHWRKDLGRDGSPRPAKFHLTFSPSHDRTDRKRFSYIFRMLLAAACHPAVWWLGGCMTVYYGGVAAISTYYAEMLETPPWSWPAANVSLINLVGIPTFLAVVILGWFSDRIVLFMARRREGISKLEDRLLITVFPSLILFATFLGFGALAQHYFGGSPSQPHWFSLCVLYWACWVGFAGGLQLTSVYLAGAVSPQFSLAALTICFAIRDLASFGLSYGIVSFKDKAGWLGSFGTYAGLSLFVGALAIPMYIYGERIRLYLDRKKIVPHGQLSSATEAANAKEYL